MPDLFVENLFTNPFYFFAVVLTVVFSIVLHELAHGWAAIRRGDQTPIYLNRMTGNPMVHMGPYSILVMLLMGIAWGQMPVDPTRLRGKYAEAFVAVAGPATNLILAIIALGGLSLWMRFDAWDHQVDLHVNAGKFLFIFGSTNVMLCIFNLFPIPPLDGSHILANFNRGYARLIGDPEKQGTFFFGIILVFVISGPLFGYVFGWVIDGLVSASGNRMAVAHLLNALWP